MFDGKFVADKDSTHEDYAERMVFTSENLSLCINRLTENDAGIFKVTYFSNFIQQSENHQVILQGMFKLHFALSVQVVFFFNSFAF